MQERIMRIARTEVSYHHHVKAFIKGIDMQPRIFPTIWAAIAISTASCSSGVADTPSSPKQTEAGDSCVSSPNCPPASDGSYSTDFSLNENPLRESGKWTTGKTSGLDWNDPQSASGKVYASVLSGASVSRYDDSIAHLSKSFQNISANQYAQGTVYLANGYSDASHEVELLLRFAIGPHDAHGYEVLWGLRGYLAVVRWNGPLGNYTPLYDPGAGSAPIPKDGDVMRAEISGNLITVKLNGNTVAAVNISSAGGTVWPSGQPGLGFWPVENASPERFGWKSFQAGSL
ncbi:hypothetical protein [Noviherbaspirillum massiliense]|uniref:hypothetical protein n=1 Tax=Noviherbaspirillum massiliense TaxID=1465823 RepID=UPI0011DDF3BE|nr:hypothetical protein [Noviherbaspirillum massiliense]